MRFANKYHLNTMLEIELRNEGSKPGYGCNVAVKNVEFFPDRLLCLSPDDDHFEIPIAKGRFVLTDEVMPTLEADQEFDFAKVRLFEPLVEINPHVGDVVPVFQDPLTCTPKGFEGMAKIRARMMRPHTYSVVFPRSGDVVDRIIRYARKVYVNYSNES